MIEQEKWNTDGIVVWRGEAGVGVCVMHFLDEREGSFAPLPLAWQARYARLISKAPELAAALRECANRFEACCITSGSDPEYAAAAVQRYRALLEQALT